MGAAPCTTKWTPIHHPDQQATLQALLADPSLAYINLHTTVNTGGAVRAQLRRTDSMSFDVTLLPSNEVPAITGLNARAWARFTAHTLRNSDGWAVAALTVFDANHEFPGSTQFTGMHLHNNTAGDNAGVVIDSRLAAANQPASATGIGNIYRAVQQTTSAALGHVSGVGSDPAGYYYNLHTTTNTGGAVRAQLSATLTAPVVTDLYPANSNIESDTVAPLGLMTLYGTNLFPATANSDSFEGTAPLMLNGVKVTVGGRSAALLTLGRDPHDYIVAPGACGRRDRQSTGGGGARRRSQRADDCASRRCSAGSVLRRDCSHRIQGCRHVVDSSRVACFRWRADCDPRDRHGPDVARA